MVFGAAPAGRLPFFVIISSGKQDRNGAKTKAQRLDPAAFRPVIRNEF